MRVSRAFRLPIIAVAAALTLSGCMRSATPVAVAPQADLDSIAYGPPAAPPAAVVVGSGGGAIGALRSAFAAPRPVVYAASAPVAYAALIFHFSSEANPLPR